MARKNRLRVRYSRDPSIPLQNHRGHKGNHERGVESDLAKPVEQPPPTQEQRSHMERLKMQEILAQGFVIETIIEIFSRNGRTIAIAEHRRKDNLGGWLTRYHMSIPDDSRVAIGQYVLVTYPRPRPIHWTPDSERQCTTIDAQLVLIDPDLVE